MDEAIAAYRNAIKLKPDHAGAHNGMSRSAVDYAAQGSPADALRLIDELLAEANGPAADLKAASLTIGRCFQHFRRLGDRAACRAAAERLEKRAPADPESLYDAACYRALIAAAQAGGPDSARLAQEEADRAMALLTKAVAAGFTDVALLSRDADLDPLRDREGFHKVLADLEAKAPPVVRAHYYIGLSQWDKAAAEYAKADLLAQPLLDDAFAYACLFLIRGDSEGYNRFCQGMIQRDARTQDPAGPYVLARTCAMSRKSPVDPARALQWANQAVTRSQKPWDYHVLGLAQYRAGQYDQALQSFTKANIKINNRYWELNWFGLALVHDRLGHPDEARQCLAKGIQWLERVSARVVRGRQSSFPRIGWRPNSLRREAEEMLKTTRNP